MSQEDDHRNAPGDPPDGPDGSGSPDSGAPSDSGGWAAPGQGPPPSADWPGQPEPPQPGFAPPGGGQPAGAPYPYGQSPGYGPPPGQGQPPGYGPPPGYGQFQQYGYAAPGPAQPGYAPPGGGQPPGPPYAQHPGYGGPPPPPKPGVVPLRPMTLGDVLNGAFSLIRNNAKTTVGLSLIVMAVASIVSSIGFSGYISDYGAFVDQAFTDPESVDPDEPLPFSTWSLAATYGGFLLSYAGVTLVTGLLTAVVGLAVLGRKLSPKEAWASVRDRIWSIVGLALLQLVIVFGLSLIVMVVGIGGLVLGVSMVQLGMDGAGILVALGSLAVGILGGAALFAWILVRIYFAMPAIVLERLKVGQALGRSWRLTRGSWWRLFGIILLANILVGIISNLLSMPFGVAAFIPAILADGEVWTAVLGGAMIYIGDVLIYSITTPFLVGVTTLLYVDLRMRREALDLKLHNAAQSGQEAGPEIYLPEPRT